MTITGIALFFAGFGLGVLLKATEDHILVRDLLDRLQFRSPSDYFFMAYQRKAVLAERRTRLNPFNWFKKKKEVPGVQASPLAVEQAIEDQIKSNEEGEKVNSEYIKQREEMISQGYPTV